MFEFIEPLIVAGEGAAAFEVGALDVALRAEEVRGEFSGEFAFGIRRGFPQRRGVPGEEVVFQREEELRAAGLALAGGAADELAVDARALVALEADDVEPARAPRCLGHRDVRAAARHVRGDGHGRGLAGLLDDVRFLGVLLCIQQAEGESERRERSGEGLAVLDRARADEHGLALRAARGDFAGDGGELGGARGEDAVGQQCAARRAVERDDGGGDAVARAQLGGGLLRGARHAADAAIEPEIRGARDGGLAGIFLRDLHARARFHRLMQSAAPCAVGAEAAGEFIDDHDLPLLHDVVDIAPEL